MIFLSKYNSIVHTTMHVKDFRRDQSDLDWMEDDALITMDGIELEKTYYFSYQISPEIGQSAYAKTLDFCFTGSELNEKLSSGFNHVMTAQNNGLKLSHSSDPLVQLRHASQPFILIYATLKILGNTTGVRKKLFKMQDPVLVKHVARYIKGRPSKGFKDVMERMLGAYLWFKAPKFTQNNAVTITDYQKGSEKYVEHVMSNLDSPHAKAMLNDVYGGNEIRMRKALLAGSIATQEHYLAPEDVKLAA